MIFGEKIELKVHAWQVYASWQQNPKIEISYESQI